VLLLLLLPEMKEADSEPDGDIGGPPDVSVIPGIAE
jgi:hypothetical protein